MLLKIKYFEYFKHKVFHLVEYSKINIYYHIKIITGGNMVLSELGLVVAGLALAGSGLLVVRRRIEPATVLWSLGGLVFAAVSILLAVLGTKLLEINVSSLVGSLYPAFLALGVIAAHTKWWKPLGLVYLILLAGIAIGIFTNLEVLKGASHGILHGSAGLILVLLPAYYYYRLGISRWSLAVSLGGLTISVGGIVLALASAGVPWAAEIVASALYPVLVISALLLAAGYIGSEGFKR